MKKGLKPVCMYTILFGGVLGIIVYLNLNENKHALEPNNPILPEEKQDTISDEENSKMEQEESNGKVDNVNESKQENIKDSTTSKEISNENNEEKQKPIVNNTNSPEEKPKDNITSPKEPVVLPPNPSEEKEDNNIENKENNNTESKEENNPNDVDNDEVDTTHPLYNRHFGKIEYSADKFDVCTKHGLEIIFSHHDLAYQFECVEVYSKRQKIIGYYLELSCFGQCSNELNEIKRV